MSMKHVMDLICCHAGLLQQYLRKHDYENYLCCLLLPEHIRTCAFALRAFNVEVAQIRDMTSEKNVAFMRIQFWKDSVEKIFKGTPPKTPVALELAKAVKRHSLSKRWLLRILDAREDNLSDRSFASIPDASQYAEYSVSSLFYLLLEGFGVKNLHADHAASHIGKAQGLVTMIRAVPYHAQRHRVLLPIDVMLQHGVSQEQIMRASREQKVKDLIYDIASAAHKELNTARSFSRDVPKETTRVFLPTVCIEAYLNLLQRADFDVFDPRLQQRNNWLPFLIWLQKVKKKY